MQSSLRGAYYLQQVRETFGRRINIKELKVKPLCKYIVPKFDKKDDGDQTIHNVGKKPNDATSQRLQK